MARQACREDFQNELEQLEVTLREEFVGVQMACDKAARDVARPPGMPELSLKCGYDLMYKYNFGDHSTFDQTVDARSRNR